MSLGGYCKAARLRKPADKEKGATGPALSILYWFDKLGGNVSHTRRIQNTMDTGANTLPFRKSTFFSQKSQMLLYFCCLFIAPL